MASFGKDKLIRCTRLYGIYAWYICQPNVVVPHIIKTHTSQCGFVKDLIRKDNHCIK